MSIVNFPTNEKNCSRYWLDTSLPFYFYFSYFCCRCCNCFVHLFVDFLFLFFVIAFFPNHFFISSFIYFRLFEKVNSNRYGIPLTLSLSLSLTVTLVIHRQSAIPLDGTQCLHRTNVFPGRPTLMGLCVGVHLRTSVIFPSLFHEECLACFVYLTWMACQMGGKWPCSCCFVKCYSHDMFKTARNIFVLFLSRSFLIATLFFRGCNHTIALTWFQFRRIPVLFFQGDKIFHKVANRSIAILLFKLTISENSSESEIICEAQININ